MILHAGEYTDNQFGRRRAHGNHRKADDHIGDSPSARHIGRAVGKHICPQENKHKTRNKIKYIHMQLFKTVFYI